MLKILYFARLRELLRQGEEEIAFITGQVDSVGTLRAHLVESRSDEWAVLLDPSTRVAVNHTIANSNTALQDGDEIAFFPPVTGG